MTASNTETQVTRQSQTSLGQDVLGFVRYWLRDRRVLIGLAAAAVVGGGVLNWGWLVAIGIAPVILAVAPCAVMCALGLCSMSMMNKKDGASCGKKAASDEKTDSNTRLAATASDQPDRKPE